MYVVRLTRSDACLATAYLATRAQHSKEDDYTAALRIIFYLKSSISRDIVVNCRDLKFHFYCNSSWHLTMMAAVTSDGSSKSESFWGSSAQNSTWDPSSSDKEIISIVGELKILKWLDNLTLKWGQPL